MSAVQQQAVTGFELRFDPLVTTGHAALAFPCDAKGQVDMNALKNFNNADGSEINWKYN